MGLESHRTVKAAVKNRDESCPNNLTGRELTFGLALFTQKGRVAKNAIKPVLELHCNTVLAVNIATSERTYLEGSWVSDSRN